MASFSPITSVLPALTSAVSTFRTFQSTFGAFQNPDGDLALQQLQDRQQLQEQQLAQNNSLERQRIALQAKQDEETRRLSLRRAVARQRASFGSSGVGNQGGSNEAVLLGLFDETQDELRRREELDQLRNSALDLEFSQRRGLNLLQATQLAERQNLNRLF